MPHIKALERESIRSHRQPQADSAYEVAKRLDDKGHSKRLFAAMKEMGDCICWDWKCINIKAQLKGMGLAKKAGAPSKPLDFTSIPQPAIPSQYLSAY